MMQERGLKPPEMERRLKPPIDQTLKCPRCDSYNTKFCYYNNYSLSQPRHFCKNCRRYWTKGGALRNVPVGGGCRKNKRAKQKTCPDHIHNQAFICSPDHNNSACPSLSPTSAFYTLPVGASDINLASLARAQQAALRLSDQQHHHHASSLSSAGCYGLSDTAHLSSMPQSAFSNHLQSLRSGLIALDFAGKAKPEPGTNSSMPDLSAFINPASHQLSNMPAVSSDISKEHINGFSLGLDSLNAEMQWRMQQHRLKEEELHRQADHGHVLLRLEEANQNEHAQTLRYSASSNSFKDVEEGSKELESWHAGQGGIFEGANGEQNYWTNGAWPSDFSMYGPSATPLL